MVCLAVVTGMSSVSSGPDVPMILVVDDTLDARELYAEYLRIAGLRAEVAEDGYEAVAKATELLPSVIIMDLAMPRMDGWEATRRLKANPLTRNIPVIALTGHVIERSRERAIEAGADGYLTKPCFPDSLLAEVQRVMKQPRQH
jgi:two-component system, cell cycle response regulator DivK